MKESQLLEKYNLPDWFVVGAEIVFRGKPPTHHVKSINLKDGSWIGYDGWDNILYPLDEVIKEWIPTKEEWMKYDKNRKPPANMDLNKWATEVWEVAELHGFHNKGTNNKVPSWCANLHGEVSELWEAYRRNKLYDLCDKDIPLTCAEEEIADIIIRALDCAKQMNMDVEKIISVKNEYNKKREYLHGGKKA